MPQWLATILVGAVINLVTAVYVYGRLTERVHGHGKKLDEHDKKLDEHGRRIYHLESGRLHR